MRWVGHVAGMGKIKN